MLHSLVDSRLDIVIVVPQVLSHSHPTVSAVSCKQGSQAHRYRAERRTLSGNAVRYGGKGCDGGIEEKKKTHRLGVLPRRFRYRHKLLSGLVSSGRGGRHFSGRTGRHTTDGLRDTERYAGTRWDTTRTGGSSKAARRPSVSLEKPQGRVRRCFWLCGSGQMPAKKLFTEVGAVESGRKARDESRGQVPLSVAWRRGARRRRRAERLSGIEFLK